LGAVENIELLAVDGYEEDGVIVVDDEVLLIDGIGLEEGNLRVV
jgi:hypothetical protein